MTDEYAVPTLTGVDAGRRLYRMYGIPNAAPSDADVVRRGGFVRALFAPGRILFVDDHDGGRPMAYWTRESVEPFLL